MHFLSILWASKRFPEFLGLHWMFLEIGAVSDFLGICVKSWKFSHTPKFS